MPRESGGMEVARPLSIRGFALRSYTTIETMFNLFKAVFGRKQASQAVSKSSRTPAALSRVEASLDGAPVEESTSRPLRDDVIELPLKAVISRLPEAVQAQVLRTSNRANTITLPVNIVLDLLKRGAVRLTVGQIKALGSSQIFQAGNAHDDVLVELPLNEILSRVRPGHLARRADQRRVFVPDDAPLIFGLTGSVKGAVRASAPLGASRASTLPTSAAEQRTEPENQTRPAVPDGEVMPRIASALPLPKLEMASGRTSESNPTRPPDSRSTVLTIALERVLSRWPELLRGAVERVAGDETVLQIPMAELEPGVRGGKVVFAWKQVRPWIVPSLGRPLDEYDAQPIELPLAEIAPIFMARRRETETRTALVTAVDIPDLFTSSPRSLGSEPSRAAEPLASVTAVSTVSFTPPKGQMNAAEAPSAVESVTLSSPTNLQTEPATHLNGKPAGALLESGRIIDYMWSLPGISGVLISTEDGLVVAAKLPSGPVAESLAAFTPPLHQRAAQYTSEIGMGKPGHLTVAVQDRLLMILKISNGYLVALGRPGESLPETQLKAFAANLNRFTPKE